jgi:serine/threonine-protein kinase HipA
MSREIFVFADWEGLEETTQIGLLRVEEVRGKEVFSFSYDENWLASGVPPDLDPDLRLFSGKQYWADDGRPNFGLFLDSSPDRWGRGNYASSCP